MIVDGTQHAVKHARLKSQLAAVLRSFSKTSTPILHPTCRATAACRLFSTHAQRNLDALSRLTFEGDDTRKQQLPKARKTLPVDEIDPRHRERTNTKHIYPNGRVYGKPGRRRREVTKPLNIDSLGKKSKIVVFQDIEEDATQSKPQNASPARDEQPMRVSSKDIEAAVLADGQEPQVAEVYASINNLRPETQELDKQAYSDLARQLTDGYNEKQLRGYLSYMAPKLVLPKLNLPSRRISAWQIARMGNQERIRGSPVASHSKKALLSESILRRAWSLTASGGTQEIGQQEVVFSKAQLDLLFLSVQTGHATVPQWQALLTSPLLARAVQAYPIRDAEVLRLEGREQDTNQVAQELLAACETRLSTLVIPFSRLQGGESAVHHLFQPSAHTALQRTTAAIVELSASASITITALTLQGCLEAQRLIYSLTTTDNVKVQQYVVNRSKAALPKQNGKTARLTFTPIATPAIAGISTRMQYRLSMIKPKLTAGDAASSSILDSRDLTRKMQEHVESADRQFNANVVQREEGVGWWRACIGMLTQHDQGDTSKALPTNFHYNSPFRDSILTLFEPYARTRHSSKLRTLTAHLVPAKDTETTQLPSIQLTFKLRSIRNKEGGTSNYELRNVSVVSMKQHILLSLPEKPADVQMQRSLAVYTKGSSELNSLNMPHSFMALVKRIKSLPPGAEFTERKQGLTYNIPLSKIALRNLGVNVPDSTDGEQLYAFSHLETQERLQFVPSHSEAARKHPLYHVMERWSPRTVLNVIERNSGKLGGQHRELLVRPISGSIEDKQTRSAVASPPPPSAKAVVEVASTESIKVTSDKPQASTAPEVGASQDVSTQSQAEDLTQSALCVLELLTTGRTLTQTEP